MVDRYTKFILTMIALALVALVVEKGSSRVYAQSDRLQKVQICDLSGCVGVTPYNVKVGSQSVRLNALDVFSRSN